MSLNAGSLGNVFIRATRPPQTHLVNRDPTPYDTQGYYLLDEWLNTTTDVPWVLVSLKGNNMSRGEVALWVHMASSGGTLVSLTGNSGGPVFVDGADNINVVGDGTTINIVGNPGTHTLTVSASGTGIVSELVTDDAHVVTPTAGVIQIAGGNNLATTGTIGPNTVTLHLAGITQHSVQIGGAAQSLTQLANGTTGQVLTAQTGADPIWASASVGATSFPTDSGTATPATGVLNIIANNAADNAGSSVLFSGSGNTVLLNVTDANNNTVIGKGSGASITSGTSNTVLGQGSLTAITTGSSNVVLGEGAGTAFTIADSNSVVISGAGQAGRSGLLQIALPTYGTVIHNYPGQGSSFNGENYFFGMDAGNFTMNPTGTVGNIGIGGGALRALASGVGGNIAIGDIGMFFLTSGVQNTGVGKDCFASAGGGAGITTGSFNTGLGFSVGGSYTGNESSNILIGPSVGGTVGESNVLRIGNSTGTSPGQTNQAFIAGIRGITTVNNDAIAVLIDSAGQLGTVSSSRLYKDNITDMGSYSDAIRSLRPVVFNYKEHSPESKSVGLIAEEVAEIAPHLVVYKDGEPETVKYHDLVPMLLNEFQKHCKIIGELQAINADLLNRIVMLEEKLRA